MTFLQRQQHLTTATVAAIKTSGLGMFGEDTSCKIRDQIQCRALTG